MVAGDLLLILDPSSFDIGVLPHREACIQRAYRIIRNHDAQFYLLNCWVVDTNGVDENI